MAIVDTELNDIQDQSIKLQELMPKIILSSAIVVTLLALWIGYSQIVMINRVIRRPKTSSGLKETSNPEVSGKTKVNKKKSSSSK